MQILYSMHREWKIPDGNVIKCSQRLLCEVGIQDNCNFLNSSVLYFSTFHRKHMLSLINQHAKASERVCVRKVTMIWVRGYFSMFCMFSTICLYFSQKSDSRRDRDHQPTARSKPQWNVETGLDSDERDGGVTKRDSEQWFSLVIWAIHLPTPIVLTIQLPVFFHHWWLWAWQFNVPCLWA